jgi:hypothetical protein
MDGCEEMYHMIGATNITDIEVSPTGKLIMTDQGGEGLFVFDLRDAFATACRHIFQQPTIRLSVNPAEKRIAGDSRRLFVL